MPGVFTLFKSAGSVASLASEVLSVEGTSFTGHIRDFMKEFRGGIDPKITKVTIGCSNDSDLSMKWATPVGEELISDFMKTLRDYGSGKVTTLSFLGCLLNGGKSEAKDVIAFADALKHNKNLRVLEVNTTAFDEQSRLILHDGLASNFGLRSFTAVSLRDRYLETKTLASLNNVLLQNATIENYRFRGDSIDHTNQQGFLRGFNKILRIQPSIQFDNFVVNKDNIAEKLHDHGLQNESRQEAPSQIRAKM